MPPALKGHFESTRPSTFRLKRFQLLSQKPHPTNKIRGFAAWFSGPTAIAMTNSTLKTYLNSADTLLNADIMAQEM
jgi:hypothetical protein